MGGTQVQIRPEARQKLNAGFQRRVDEQAARYAPELAHAAQLAARFECGQLAGVFAKQAGGEVTRRAYAMAFLSLLGIPVLIAAAAARVPGVLPLLFLYPFLAGAWVGLCMWLGRTPKRRVWFYAFTEGFMLVDDLQPAAAPVLWSQVTWVSEVWTRIDVSEGPSTPRLTAFRLHLAAGQAVEISRSFQNVQDPYGPVGQMIKGMMPAAGQILPDFPTVDQIVAAYAIRR